MANKTVGIRGTTTGVNEQRWMRRFQTSLNRRYQRRPNHLRMSSGYTFVCWYEDYLSSRRNALRRICILRGNESTTRTVWTAFRENPLLFSWHYRKGLKCLFGHQSLQKTFLYLQIKVFHSWTVSISWRTRFLWIQTHTCLVEKSTHWQWVWILPHPHNSWTC